MTKYRLYLNRIQVAIGLALCAPLPPIALFMTYDQTKTDAFTIFCMPAGVLCFALAAIGSFQLAIGSWAEYYGSPNMFQMTFKEFVRERLQWARDGYRTRFEIEFGKPPKTRPPA